MRARRMVWLAAALLCTARPLLAQPATRPAAQPTAPIPAHNRADQRVTPPRPAFGDLDDRARKLWAAIVHDDPALAEPVFFPREAFLLVKDIADPGRYYDQLHRRFEQDIHALHAHTPQLAAAQLEGLELGARGGFMAVHSEGNRLPYWAARHCWLRYRVGRELRRLTVRVLISWDDRWYVIHLSEFHTPAAAAKPALPAGR